MFNGITVGGNAFTTEVKDHDRLNVFEAEEVMV